MLLFMIGIVAILAILFYYRVKTTFSYWTKKNVHQADISTCLDNIRKTFLSSMDFLQFWERFHARSKKYRYVGSYEFTKPILVVQDADLIKSMLVKDFDHFVNHRMFAEQDADPLWYRSLFSLKGEQWRAMRATLSPTFTGSKMRGMFALINEEAKKYVEFYKSGPAQFSIECKDSFTRLSNDIIASCAFGIQVDSLKEPNNEFYLAAKGTNNFNGFINMVKFLLGMMSDFFKKLMKVPVFTEKSQKFFGDLISSTLKYREEKNIVRPDMIHLLMEARRGLLKHEEEETTHKDTFSMLEPSSIDRNDKLKLSDLSDVDITAQAMLFISGGFDTIATQLSLLAYEVGVNTDVQERLRLEIKDTLEANKGELNYNAISSMKYLDMVISESLRKWPPGIVIDRVCTKPYKIPKDPENYNEADLTLNSGDLVYVNAYGIHRDPDIYADPEKFDPERFNDDNKHKITPYNYMPFGVGPRHCIAIRFALMEMKTILCHLLLNYELYPVEKTNIPMRLEKDLNIMAKGGYWLGFKRIDS